MKQRILFIGLALVLALGLLPAGSVLAVESADANPAALTVGVWMDEGSDGAGVATPEYDGLSGQWEYEESDTPTGTAVKLFEVWGGFWADAEKDPPNGSEDTMLCWAATASNMLEYTGWGFVDHEHNGVDLKFGNTDDFFQFFKDHITDDPYFAGHGITWWFNGQLTGDPPPSEREGIGPHEGFWLTEDPDEYQFVSEVTANILPNIADQILGNADEGRAGRPVGLSIRRVGATIGHAVTCWGFNYDDEKDPDDPEHYVGIWISDSDSHMQWDPPNVLTYYALTWDSSEERWEITYGGMDWFIARIVTLEVFREATRPEADAGEPYEGYEGTAVTFNASGSFDDSGETLWYRWDFEGDGVWNTEWSTDPYAEFTYYDDYEGDVYLEVFNERLRDMSITTVTIANVAPVVTAQGDTINENEYATVSGNITDPGIHDTFTVVIDWGDGTVTTHYYDEGTKEYSEQHQYLDDGESGVPTWTYAVNVTVIDKDEGVGTATTTVTVNNVDPVVEEPYISSQPNDQFILPVIHEVEFSAAFANVGTLDTHKAVWDWGDGTTADGLVTESGGSGNVTGRHTYMLPGEYTVTVTVTDDDTGIHSNTMIVRVADVDEALEDLNQYIQDLDDSFFRGQAAQRRNAFENMFSALQNMWLQEAYTGMITNLSSHIHSRADGLIDGRANDDWITDLEAQEHICQKVDDITLYLEYLLGR